MKNLTLCFCLRNDNVLLAIKKIGHGAGKWNSYGGKIEEGESPKKAAARELKEESGLIAQEEDLKQVGFIHFSFDGRPLSVCSVYVTTNWQGEPVETDEMGPHQWFPFSSLPFENMWVADTKWIPLILDGKLLEAQVDFSADGTEVKYFSFKEVVFND